MKVKNPVSQNIFDKIFPKIKYVRLCTQYLVTMLG